MKRVMSIAIIVLALTIAIVPAFYDCQSHGRSLTTQDGRSVPMKCHWAGIAAIGAAVPLALTGILNLRKQRQDSTRSLSALGFSSGMLAILFPTLLIGVCANPDMICNMVMKPALILAGTLACLISIMQFATAKGSDMNLAKSVA